MIIFIGASGVGKTTLAQALHGEDLSYRKTQTIEILADIIDTPGEFLERKQLTRNLLVSSFDADLVAFVEAADDEQLSFPPGFSAMFAAPVIGIITKCDQPVDQEKAKFGLEYAGAERIFAVSAVTGEGISALAAYLKPFAEKRQ